MILGLDISTSVTGYTIFDGHGKLIIMNHIELSKIKDGIWAKVDVMKDFIQDVNRDYDIDYVFIEEPLSKFKRGKSNSHTISLLLRFNGIISYLIHQEMNIDAAYIGASNARRTCGLTMRSKAACKREKKKWKPQKQQAFDQMNEQSPFNSSHTWPLKRTGRIKDFCYDQMDSYIICKAGFIELIS